MVGKINGVELTTGVTKGAALVDHVEAISVPPVPTDDEG